VNRHTSLLLLNLAVLIVNFVVAWGVSDAQVRVLRTTARVAHAVPLAPPRPVESPGVPRARLLKYLGRLPGLDRLTRGQVDALHESLDYCCSVLAEEGEGLRGLDGAAVRASLGGLQERLRDNVAASLRAARVEDPQLLEQLVRIVVSSTG